jgi:hypothetical protein
LLQLLFLRHIKFGITVICPHKYLEYWGNFQIEILSGIIEAKSTYTFLQSILTQLQSILFSNKWELKYLKKFNSRQYAETGPLPITSTKLKNPQPISLPSMRNTREILTYKTKLIEVYFKKVAVFCYRGIFQYSFERNWLQLCWNRLQSGILNLTSILCFLRTTN